MLLSLGLGLALLTGCPEEPEIRSYTTDKPELGYVKLPGLLYKPAYTWNSMGSARMVMALYQIESTEGLAKMTVSRATGTLTANIDRWRGQIGLPKLTEEVDPDKLESIDTEAGKVLIVDMQSELDPSVQRRIRVGMLPGTDKGKPTGQTWFFKLDGPAPIVKEQVAAFDKMLASLKLTKDNLPPDARDDTESKNGTENDGY